jgi:pimeloyl-ACP methyl ester carboxylesterase
MARTLFPYQLAIQSILLCSSLALSTLTHAQQGATLLGGQCTPGADNPLTEPGTGRTFVLDYPCDLRADESVTFILNLHGGGSNTLYQRAYFPAWELKEKHRLVVATPYSPVARWREEDDEYLQNIVSMVTGAIGEQNINAFWLVGHSQGGLTSRRLICTDFFADKVNGFVSLSGGRLGGAPQRAPNAGRPVQNGAATPATPPAAAATPPAAPAAPAADPACDFSHIYAIGEYEIVELPATSALAERYQCSARIRHPDVVDTEAGRIYDSRSQDPGTREWGLLPGPGTAEVFEYPDCADGRVIADVVRINKGHTEGLEPLITERIIELMLQAALPQPTL